MTMKRIFLISVFVLLLLGIACAQGYEQYSKVYLGWAKSLKVMSSFVAEEEGWHHVVFQAQTVNNSSANGNAIVVMIAAKLFLNGLKIKGWTENVDSNRHYCNPTLVKDLYLYPGDLVEIKMRADSMRPYPSHSVFVLVDEDRFQFDVSKF